MSAPPKTAKRFSFVLEKIACGKGTCGTCQGTKLAHGPYWYAYYVRKGGGTGKVYVGKDLDEWKQQYGVKDEPAPAPKKQSTEATKSSAPSKSEPPKKDHPDKPIWERMMSPQASPVTAGKILGVKPGVTRKEVTSRFRELIKKHHPDKGGCSLHAMALNAAYEMLKKITT